VTFQAPCPLPRARADRVPAFERDVLELRPALVAFARRLLRQEPDVEDLVQDTIVKALSARNRFQEGTNLKAWLFTIMRNSFNTRWRKSRRETIPGPEAIELGAVMPATQTTDLWAREALGRLMNDLSPAHREILILIPVLGLGYEDAAEVCNCSVGTVKSRLNRARMALATLVDGAGP
jgi:RNA polymerase sigma factor (sigma-70 family)